eukprot:7375827-Pyramimonas_sp.AAC.1
MCCCGYFQAGALSKGLNQSNFAFIPKGEDPQDLTDCIRDAASLRPSTLKSTDSEALAQTVNINLSTVAKERVHRVQQSFIGGRNFGNHIMNLDAETRLTSLGDDASERRPRFGSFDFRVVFPSMSQQWLRAVLRRFGLPQGHLNALEALPEGSVGYFNVGSQRVRLFGTSRGVPHGCPLSGTLWALGMDPLVRHLVQSCEAASEVMVPAVSPRGSTGERISQ